MEYQNRALCKIRTITVFLSLEPNQEQWKQEIYKASNFLSKYSKIFHANGYEVQSIRIVTNPFAEYLDTSSLEKAQEGFKNLKELLVDLEQGDTRVRFAIGEAKTKKEINLLPELIRNYADLCNACVNVRIDQDCFLDSSIIDHTSNTILKISQITPRGEGNFNFTVNCNCNPHIPYFPAGYHRKEYRNQFVIGLETPDLLLKVNQDLNKKYKNQNQKANLKDYFFAMSSALQHHILEINTIIKNNNSVSDYQFTGFDSSAAPSKSCASLADIYESMGVEYFGASGTVEASSILTRVFKSIKGVNLVGFSGLMLALTEDMGLAKGSIKGNFDIRALLTYSAVCGIGLDTVPIPGDTPPEKISALIRDTATLAFKLNKPLTVRLFPVPGLKAGDITSFESDDLCNCAVIRVP